MKNRKDTQRRRKAAVVAGIAAIGLLVTGTLAWQAISQRAVNNVEGEILPAGARLHDDFGLADQPDFTQPLNKDVYVENYSGQNPQNTDDTGEPVFVRVKLLEYMEMGEGAGLFSVSGDDPSDYQTLDQVDADGTRIEDSNNDAVPLVSGASILELSTWRTHTEGDTSNPFSAYWTWTMGGSKAFMPTFNKDSTSLLTDRTDYAHDKFTAGSSTLTAMANYANPAYDLSEEHTAKDTLTAAGIVSMAEWKANGSPVEKDGLGYWVGDTDGWYYWSKSLMPGDATALLLDQITLKGGLEGEFYYGIHVISQMATAGDWGDEGDETGFYDDGLTEDGRDLLDQAANANKPTYEVILTQVDGTGNGTPNTVNQEGTISYTAKVRKTDPIAGTTVDADDQTVKWELLGTYQAGTTIANMDTSSDEYTDGGVTLTVATDEAIGENLLTLRATSNEGTKVQTVNVSIAEKLNSPADSVPEGGVFEDDKGIQWQVLTTDEDGNKLVMTTAVYNKMPYNALNEWSMYSDSNLMKDATTGLSYFYTNSIGSDIKAVALPVTITDVRDAVGTPVYNRNEKLPEDLSKAGSGAATAINAPFVLSISEYNTYEAQISTAINNDYWWLRTPGDSSTHPVSGVFSGPDLHIANYTNVGYRLALWIKSS